MAGYSRQSAADIIANAVIKAAPVNAEYNAIRDAFALSGGHKHDGSSTEGAYVPLIADTDALNKVVIDTSNNRIGFFSEVSSAAVEQLRIQDGAIVPVTDNDIDLGTSSLEFKDLYVDGIGYIDTVQIHENATITGNLTVNGNTTLGDADSDTVTVTADVASPLIPSADNTHDLGAVGSEWRNLYVTGTANIDALVADTADIDGGTIDGAVIGGNTAAAGSFTTVGSSGLATLNSLTVTGATALNGGLTMDTNKFTVADTSGNTAIAGTLDVTGQTTVANFTATGTTILPATSFGDNNITNVGDIALDSISADDSTITITGNTTFADGSFNFDIASHDGTNGLALGGTVVTASAAELNKLDGVTATTAELNILAGGTSATSTTVADADRVVLNDNGAMVQVAVTDLAAYFDDEITAMPNLVSTGALDSGSITSGFGTINTGSSTITTTGAITGGSLVISDGGNIGSASDTDAISIASGGNVTMTQDLTVTGNLTVNGSTSTISTTNTTIEDALIELGTGTTGTPSNDAGIVIERGSEDNAFIGYDESADKFIVGTGSFTGASTGNLTISTGTLVANVEGAVTGNASTATALANARTIAGQSFDGTANISIAPTDLTGVNSTATELNIMDGDTSATSTTLADADRVVVNDDGTMVQVALTDFETYFEGALDTLSNVTTVGALNAGSITSGFGAIDNGSSAITTTGTITYGSLSDGAITVTAFVDEDNMASNSATLIPTQQSVKAYVDSVAGSANNVTGLNATGAELNAVADFSAVSVDTSTAIANNDAILMFDNGNEIGYRDVDLLDTYFAGTIKTLTNKTLTEPTITTPTVTGLHLNDSGFTVEGSSVNDNETTVSFTNPTADRTITFPDATGTVVTTGNLSDISGTIGTLTSLTVDDITIDGSTISDAGDLTVDVGGTITLDADSNGQIDFEDGGNKYGQFHYDTSTAADGSASFVIQSIGVDRNILFAGNDNSSLVIALTLDMSEAGAATFNSSVTAASATLSGDLTVDTNTLKVDSSNNRVGIGDATPSVSLDIGSNTDAVHVPSGTTAQRPTGANGMFRYNSDDGAFEGYAGGAWGAIGGGGGDSQTASTSSTAQTAIATYTASSSLGIEITVVATDTVATERTITKLLVTHDGSTAVATQYGEVNTATAMASYDVDINSGNVRLLATAASSNATNFSVNAVVLA